MGNNTGVVYPHPGEYRIIQHDQSGALYRFRFSARIPEGFIEIKVPREIVPLSGGRSKSIIRDFWKFSHLPVYNPDDEGGGFWPGNLNRLEY